MRRCNESRARFRSGLSLTEVVVSTMLVGLVLVGSMNGIGGVVRMQEAAQQDSDGLALAQQLMAEVLQQHYLDPNSTPAFGLEGAEVASQRSTFDDVDDYHNWNKTPPVARDGTALKGYDGWTRSIVVEWVKLTDPNGVSGADLGLKRITVKVKDPSGGYTVVQSLRSKWGALENPLAMDATIQSMVDSTLDMGSGVDLQGGVNFSNHARD